ncbi:hypothetical protein BBO99_00003816 [Phytophthora kernoviae]|uniref:Fatty acid hydroxylase domain-containing protein n=2 Tax=Phytophthora kernoviae TaxID=325452 RepID=A0A421EVE5_9STRA|nr:hypothetical protein G195_004254 [Phytophthora kernoviae 00238/432]KAG2527598.1 hypothetical protein JM16_003364 [Phytophthora kernoviae]KAG2528878.1 hypothetical protein JM18_003104 [Phytophthora kernoviae]RLN02894.1 hypothetical protein BBI17_003864 [Phytophthora kernoviae]RLN81305.1 hypothetical protein BBO99_00003816 [Phytophthora kernoviae]
MDLILEYADEYILDAVYTSDVPRDAITRQITSISVLTLVGGYFLYLTGAGFAYHFLFDKELIKHPKFQKNQIWKEITYSMTSIPVMMLLTLPWFLADVRGYSKTYAEFGKFGFAFEAWTVVWFIFFSDMLIYWFHRWLHYPLIYALLHKPHHKWIICSPFSSHAFHPVDGYIQSLPYHFFIMLFPIHRGVFLALFVAVNYWTISIHDGYFLSQNSVINGALHHSVHHEQFVYNYGQYFTLWDHLCGSYREPPKTGYSAPKQCADIKTQEAKKLNKNSAVVHKMDPSELNRAAAAQGAEVEDSPFQQKLLHCCGSRRWAAEMYKKFPVRDFAELCDAADQVDGQLTHQDWLEAFAAHPRIGRAKKPIKEWEAQEQKATKDADEEVLDRLEELNDVYYKKFGYIYIVCATGKSAPEMLSILETRLRNSPEDELSVAGAEQGKISKLRLEKLLQQ